MIRYYDKTNHQLVYVNQKADPQFWDEQWSTDNFVKAIKGPKNRFTVRFTTKYLKRGARLLEGGCGRGDKVYALHSQGYDVYGVDYASKTVQQINEYTPELKVSLGDVRNLQFDNDFFDGYWSFGVIEHFYDGYFPILKEMHRVLRNGGYLFLTTPSMSLLRSIKAKLGCYPKFQETDDIKQDFYQFALNSKSVTYNFERIGFQLIEMKFYGGNIGIQQDANLCEPIFNPVCKNRFSGSAISLLTSQFANHMTLYIFKKNG